MDFYVKLIISFQTCETEQRHILHRKCLKILTFKYLRKCGTFITLEILVGIGKCYISVNKLKLRYFAK